MDWFAATAARVKILKAIGIKLSALYHLGYEFYIRSRVVADFLDSGVRIFANVFDDAFFGFACFFVTLWTGTETGIHKQAAAQRTVMQMWFIFFIHNRDTVLPWDFPIKKKYIILLNNIIS